MGQRQFDTSPTQGWGKVGARLGQGLGQGPGKVRARLGQGLDKKQGSGKVWAGKVWARLGQGPGKVGARSGQKARFRQGRGKLAAIPIYFTLITPPSLSPASITNQSLYHYLLIYSPISSASRIDIYPCIMSISISILSIFLVYLFYLSDPSVSIPLSILPLFLYFHIYRCIYSISTSIPLSILALSPHLSLYLFDIYLQIYPCMSDILRSIGVVVEFQR